jgi:hypothetical protein
MKRKYAVTTRFAFTGTFVVAAENRAEAAELVQKHCGMVSGDTIHSTLPTDDVDWEFPVHPDKAVLEVRPLRRKEERNAELVRELPAYLRRWRNTAEDFN